MNGREIKSFLLGVGLMMLVGVLFYSRPQFAASSSNERFVEEEQVVAENFDVDQQQQQQQSEEFVQQQARPPPPPPPAPANSNSNGPIKRMPRHCLQGDTSDAYYQCRRAALLNGCSEICNTNILGEPSQFFNFARKHVNCDGVWMNEEIDASLGDGQWPPPVYPPSIFIEDYRQQGRVNVMQTRHLAQRYSGGDAFTTQWTKESLENMVAQARAGTLQGSYSATETNAVRDGLRQIDIKGKRVLVIGSEQPWVEACALEAGAAEVWTLEYGRIHSTHPQVFTVTPDEARQKYIDGTLPLFDAVLTFSSVEHSGLGRYGDALNPWGDMQAIARAWCITKPGGNLLLGVMECGASDSIEYNLHRCYHTYAYTHLTANWQQLWRGRRDTGQPVHIFRREEAPAAPRS